MKQLYKFDAFIIDVGNRLLYKDGEPVSLKPKVFDTLLLLVEGKGNLLEKEKLLNTLWSNTTVEENNLTQNISILRKALGEKPDGESYIETMPKRGYRFRAAINEYWDKDDALIVEKHARTHIVIEQKPVELDEKLLPEAEEGRTKLLQDVATLAPAVPKVKWWQSTRTLLALSLVALVSIGAAITALLWTRPPIQQEDWRLVLHPTPVLSIKKENNDWIEGGRFNSNAKLIAYTREQKGKEDVWFTTLGGESSQQVTKDEFSNRNPIWVPETEELAYISQRGEKLGIWKTNLIGFAPTLIKSFDEGEHGPNPRVLPNLKRWIHQTIYYEWAGNFYALNVATREIKNLTNFDASKTMARGFDISPDEEWICYIQKINGQSDIWKKPRDGGDPVAVTNDAAEEKAHLLWYPDGKRILYKASQDGANQICSVNAETRKKTQITFEKDDGSLTDISADGTKFLYAGRSDESDLWKVGVSDGKDERVTNEPGVEFWPVVSPDSKTVAFQKIEGLQIRWNPIESALYTKAPSANNPQVALATDACRPQWSPDGKVISFIHSQKGVQNLWLFDPASGEQRAITTAGVSAPASIVFPFNTNEVCGYTWSPDSSRIVYRSREESISNITIVNRDGTNKTQITDNQDPAVRFVSPIWSPDGKKVAYVVDEVLKLTDSKLNPVWKLWVYDGQAGAQWLEFPQTIKLLGWINNEEILIATIDNAPANQHTAAAVSLAAVSITKIRDITKLEKTYANNVHLSSDGKTVAFVSTQDGNHNIYTLSIGSKASKKLTENREPQVFFSSLTWSPDGSFIVYGRQSREYLLTLMNNLKLKGESE